MREIRIAVIFSNFLERDAIFFKRLTEISSSLDRMNVDGRIFIPKDIYHSKMKRISPFVQVLENGKDIFRKAHCIFFQEPWFKIERVDWNILCKKIHQSDRTSYMTFNIRNLKGSLNVSLHGFRDLINHMIRFYPKLRFLYIKGLFKTRELKSISLDSQEILKDWEHLMSLRNIEGKILLSNAEVSLDESWILDHQSFMKGIFLKSFVRVFENTANLIKNKPDFVVLDFIKKIFYLFEIEQWDDSLIAENQREDFQYNQVDYDPLVKMSRKILSDMSDEVAKERMKFFTEYLTGLFDSYKKPLVSVLIPVYNQLGFFKEALDSAVSQTYPNIEIVIGDDSTNVDVRSYMDKFIKKMGLKQSIRYYFLNRETHKDFGAYNKSFLFKIANGSYISYLSHDDIIHPEKIRIMMHFLILEPEVRLVTSYRKLITEEGEMFAEIPPLSYKRFSKYLIIDDGLAFGRVLLKPGANYIGEPSTAMFRKKDSEEDFGNYKGWRARMADDIAQWLKLLGKGRGVYIPVPLNFTRIHKSQLTWNFETKLAGIEDSIELLFRSVGEFITHYEAYVMLMEASENLEDMILHYQEVSPDLQEKILSLHQKCKFYLKELRDFILQT